LLHLLLELKESWKLKLAILHVNHKLRGKASERDEAFVRRLARRFKIPIFVTRVPVKQIAKKEKISLEEAGRETRYHFFEKTAEAKRAHKIAAAHTRDDQAETVLMRVIGGTGLQGLQAIRPKRKLNGIFLVRPLIEIPRQEIRQFVKSNRIRFREDRSNRSLQFLRNRIRLKLLPFLERSFNPQVKRALARLPYLLDVDLAFLDETAEIFYKRLANPKHADEILFPKQSFLQIRPSIQYRLINRALRNLAEAELDFDHWNMFLDHLATERRFRLQLPKGLFASVSPEAIRIRRAKKLPSGFSHSLSLEEPLYLPEIDATLFCDLLSEKLRVVRKTDKSFDVFDGEKLSFPLTVRSRRPGDRFRPLGQTKPSKLKEFLINKRIPLEERDHLPLLLSEGKIAWVGGVAMGDAFKVSAETKQFIQISLKLGNQI
ncbi:MAG: tRNA lysidine(34) synthetase TilS, partial [Candidatus Omnitrophica bacterium]|nr:tRNA lysidine(34) synthetase TilS [Candidatus Omnitrophota bacterium]